jgi:hydrogenase/urease accessory protein HupE
VWFSLVGLGLLVAVIVVRGWPKGPALFEVIGVAGLFFGGTLGWSLYLLLFKDRS